MNSWLSCSFYNPTFTFPPVSPVHSSQSARKEFKLVRYLVKAVSLSRVCLLLIKEDHSTRLRNSRAPTESLKGIQDCGKRYGQLTNSPNPPWVTSPWSRQKFGVVCKRSGVLEVHPRPPVNHRDRTRALVSGHRRIVTPPASNGLGTKTHSYRTRLEQGCMVQGYAVP